MGPRFNKLVSEVGISYHKAGRGPCLVLIHGVGLRAESWHQYLDQLGDHFELLIPDLPGHGNSCSLSANYSQVKLADFTERLIEFSNEVAQGPFYLCGHSLGSLIAIEIASTLSEKVLGLVALNAIHGRSTTAQKAVQMRAEQLWKSDRISGVGQTVERWFGATPNKKDHPHAGLCEHWLRSNSLNGYATAYKSFADERGPSNETLKSITCPSLYMTGELDLNSSPEMAQRLAQLSPQSRSLTIATAGHMMPLTHAEDVIRELIKMKSSSIS